MRGSHYARNLLFASPSKLHELALVFAGVGALCRVAQYAAKRSLWHDEVSITLSLVATGFLALFGPLEREQAAPPLWSLLERATVLLFGESEYTLRFWPMVAGVASLLVFFRLARHVLSPSAVPVAVLLFAVSDRLITHSAEVKPYSTDVLVAVSLLTVATLPGATQSPLRSLARVTALAIPGMWFSFPSVFVYGGISLAVAGRLRRVKRRPAAGAADARRAWLGYVTLNALAGASFLSLFLLSASRQSSTYLREYWTAGYPIAQAGWRFPLWFLEVHYDLCNYAYAPMGWLIGVLVIFGVSAIWRGDRRGALAILLLPLGLTFLAASFRYYPYTGNRFLLFAVPGVLLLAAEGLFALTRRLAPQPAVLLAAMLVLPGLGLAGYHLLFPRSRHELRPILTEVNQKLQPGDRLLVMAHDSFDYYWERMLRANPQAVQLVGPKRQDGERRARATPLPHEIIYVIPSPSRNLAQIDRLLDSPRFWIIYTAHGRIQPQYDRMIDTVRPYADEVETLKASGARAHLFLVRGAPSPPLPGAKNMQD